MGERVSGHSFERNACYLLSCPVRHSPILFSYALLFFLQSAHPFGPFSNSTTLSSIYTDSILRNSVLSRVMQALRLVKQSVSKVDAFNTAWVEDAGSEDVEQHEQAASLSLFAYFKGTNKPPAYQGLARAVSVRLASDLSSLEEQFFKLANLIQEYK